MSATPATRRPNRLIGSTSPYLRQHAYQPVDWYPWGPEALQRAVREDRPILLSVGYSACHWCHVMAHESFEDPELARRMNDLFVCIKVDREERPDIDQVYQTACQILTGQGGWPLTVFLTPDLLPYYAGTYFPPRPRLGRPGFGQVLEACARAYRERREEVRQQAHRLARAVQEVLDPTAALAERRAGPDAGPGPTSPALVAAADALLHQADTEAGGFGGAPKFPHATGLALLERVAWRFGHAAAREHLLLTLERMALGGLFDQVGGGFHRYTVDRWWQVPHFEKMLYDNALLVPLYVRAGRGPRPDLLRVAAAALDFMLETMRLPDGGFACSLDADSPGPDGRPQEGYYYRWSPEQVREAVGDAALSEEVCRAFGIGPGAGDAFERRAPDGPPGWSEEALTVVGHVPGLPRPEFGRLRHALARMKAYRERSRRPPARDDKVLTGWHALALSALVAGWQGGAGGEPERYRQAAEAGWAFLCERLQDGSRGLLHVPPDGERVVPAFADDYAFAIHAALDLFRCTQERRYLEEAVQLAEQAEHRLAREGVYLTSSEAHASPLARAVDIWDQATPSPNAAMASAHARLAACLDDPTYLERGLRVIEMAWPVMRQHVSGTAGLWCALDDLDGGMAVVSVQAPRLEAVREELRRLLRLPHPALDVRWVPDPGEVRWQLCLGTRCLAPERDGTALLPWLEPQQRGVGERP
ncbi:MAG: thioredoxin domain-containing protein [Firmicutes bacterium]|nr:thioredoxin domain-containing protein [Bacillota bacterium]